MAMTLVSLPRIIVPLQKGNSLGKDFQVAVKLFRGERL